MRRPWEVTPEEARAEADRLRKRRRAADRLASSLLSTMLAEMDAEEECGGPASPEELP
jgi:hypothetical protein